MKQSNEQIVYAYRYICKHLSQFKCKQLYSLVIKLKVEVHLTLTLDNFWRKEDLARVVSLSLHESELYYSLGTGLTQVF